LRYKITGNVKDEKGDPVAGIFVEAYDSDFGTSDDYLGNTKTDPQGSFTMTFDDREFRERFEFFERRPDEYIVLSDSYGILYKSEIRSEAKDVEVFNVILKDTRPMFDPYANTFQREISSLNSIVDTVTISQVDLRRSINQILRNLTNWSYYTAPKIMNLYGCPGPQVPKYPKQQEHSHSLPWNLPWNRKSSA
jgi:hypothetical protein